MHFLLQNLITPLLNGVVGGSHSAVPSSASTVSLHLLPRNYSSDATAEASFETRPYKLHKLEEAPNSTTNCTREDALLYYRQMQTVRRIESAAGNLYKEKVKICIMYWCGCHIGI